MQFATDDIQPEEESSFVKKQKVLRFRFMSLYIKRVIPLLIESSKDSHPIVVRLVYIGAIIPVIVYVKQRKKVIELGFGYGVMACCSYPQIHLFYGLPPKMINTGACDLLRISATA